MEFVITRNFRCSNLFYFSLEFNFRRTINDCIQGSYSATLILRSGKHCTDAHLTVDTYGDQGIHFLLDFNIAFLGVDKIEYDIHSKNIRKEYDHLNDEEYSQQRLKVRKYLFLSLSYSWRYQIWNFKFTIWY